MNLQYQKSINLYKIRAKNTIVSNMKKLKSKVIYSYISVVKLYH